MSKFGNKLAQLGRPISKEPNAPVVEASPVAEQLVRASEDASLTQCSLDSTSDADALPGEVVETQHGPLRRCVTTFAESHHHGSVAVAHALKAAAQDLSVLALDPTLAEIDFSRALYLDTETTGLLGGAGTLPFLVGMARFEGRALTVEQLLLERPGQEAPILARLAELMAEASCIVSFNGKSFDWPLLRTRYILNRVKAPKVPGHLDLLHCARRIYKRRLGTVRLIHLERAILGFERVDDLPGELIPETYLAFLRGRASGGTLRPIVEHNLSDLVALPALLGEVARRFASGEGEAQGQARARQDARDELGFARVAARAEDSMRAVAWAESAAEQEVHGELAAEALILSGTLKLKLGELEAAERAFSQALSALPEHSLLASRAHLALAKLLEHKRQDFAAALRHAEHTAEAEGVDAQQRRLSRLARKLEARGTAMFDEPC